MKEIGEQFKEKRKEIGISIKEVSNDLNIDEVVLDNLEEGNNKVFKDVLEFKEVSMEYAKYLGLDDEKVMDDINDYLFEKTSKIKIEDIKDEFGKTDDSENRIKTPYTVERKEEKKDNGVILIIILIVILLVIFYIVLRRLFIS